MGEKVLELESERLKAVGQAEGEVIGQARGEAIGEARFGSLINRLIQDKREEIRPASTAPVRREELYKEHNI